jgi:hypothetical protein
MINVTLKILAITMKFVKNIFIFKFLNLETIATICNWFSKYWLGLLQIVYILRSRADQNCQQICQTLLFRFLNSKNW